MFKIYTFVLGLLVFILGLLMIMVDLHSDGEGLRQMMQIGEVVGVPMWLTVVMFYAPAVMGFLVIWDIARPSKTRNNTNQ